MKIFLVEDDINVIKIIERIIQDRDLGDFIGFAKNGQLGIKQIHTLKPDIVIVDLLMPGKDGISLVNEAKATFPHIQFIMISQVSSKDMIAKAYQSGVEYYISKPINAIEVENIIQKVVERLKMNRTLAQIQNLFNKEQVISQPQRTDNNIQCIKRVMQKIGVLGEAGSQDIINITTYLIEQNRNILDFTVRELCSLFTDNPKSIEQRIRRTAAIGMSNLANLGIEDYMNDTFIEYSNSLYNFEQIRIEMDYIRKKTKKRGKVNLRKFLDGMISYCSK